MSITRELSNTKYAIERIESDFKWNGHLMSANRIINRSNHKKGLEQAKAVFEINAELPAMLKNQAN